MERMLEVGHRGQHAWDLSIAWPRTPSVAEHIMPFTQRSQGCAPACKAQTRTRATSTWRATLVPWTLWLADGSKGHARALPGAPPDDDSGGTISLSPSSPRQPSRSG
jgi:hypothetical protein